MLKDLLKSLENMVENNTFVFVVTVFVSIYAVFAAPEMPSPLENLFNNQFFRFGFVFLIAYLASMRKPMVSLLVTLAFFCVMHVLNVRRTAEQYVNYKFYENFQNNAGELVEETSEEETAAAETLASEEKTAAEEESAAEEETSAEEESAAVVPKKLRLRCEVEQDNEEGFQNYEPFCNLI